MNIKEHIEANHYPRDEKGRALVPTRGGYRAVIMAIDCPEREKPLAGWYFLNDHRGELASWHADGHFEAHLDCGNLDLLPPPPRKVKVTGKLRCKNGDMVVWDLHGCEGEWSEGMEIKFTGEYEEEV